MSRHKLIQATYELGVQAHRNGKPDVNPYGATDLLQFCAWSAGYFDSKRGMV